MPDQIVTADCIHFLNDGPADWINLAFADPPFNIGYLYHGYDDERKQEDYLKFSEDWMRAVHRALRPDGSFYLAIGDEYAADLCVIARRKIGFNLRNWIVWHYTFGQQTKRMFAKSHTHILYFTKDEKNFTFNPDAVRVASARQTTYADVRANPKGKLAGRRLVSSSAGSSGGIFRGRPRHLERQPGLRNFQGARRLARLPDADGGIGSDHPRQQQSRRYGGRSVQRQRDHGGFGRPSGPEIHRHRSERAIR